MKLTAMVVLVLVLARCAPGEGGTGSEGHASPTIAEETTSDSPQEETTTLNEESDLKKPPHSTLSYGGKEVEGTLGSYCWSSGNSSGCADSVWPIIPSKHKTLTVPPDSEIVFRYGEPNPPKTVEARAYTLNKLKKTGMYRPDHPLKPHGSGVERTIPAELPPGEYVLEVFVKEQQGDASYYFRIMVK